MLKNAILTACILTFPLGGQAQSSTDSVRVEIVATASEYVPQSTTVSTPGHVYTDCSGRTSFFGNFQSSSNSGSFSGSADTDARCSATFSPPSETTITRYNKVNYTIVKSDQVLFLLACTQKWKLTTRERILTGTMGALEGGSGSHSGDAERARARAQGKWTDCPAFFIGSKYVLSVRDASDARLEGLSGNTPVKLEYLKSARLPVESPTTPEHPLAAATQATVHMTSSPSGADIYVDGKFCGNTPSDLTLAAGEHAVRVAIGGNEWSRVLKITAGEIRVHAEIIEKQ
jgi:PEGA domain